MAKRRTTLAEVAGAAGVSVATVSKVLNDREDVSAETRYRVQRYLRESAYRSTGSESARQRHQSQMIEVVFGALQNGYSIAILDAITSAAQQEGFQVVIGRYKDDRAGIDPQRLLKSGLAGAILITTDASTEHLKTLGDSGFPVVVVDPQSVSDSHCISIGATNFAGGVAATEHLLSLGHRRISHAGGPELGDSSQARLAGYTSALRRAGIELDESLVTHSRAHFSYDEGRRAANYLLGRPDPPTAIFAASDEVALGVMEEARRRGIRVPGQLSVVGFDDTFLATRSAPQLTTVAQPLLEMGRLAIRSISQLIRNDVVGTSHIELATRLVVRDSTAARTSGGAATAT